MNDKVKAILAKLQKNNGNESVQLLGDNKSVQGIKRIPTGCYSIDKAIGGGIPLGRIIEIFGPESSGKSTVCLEIVSQFQKQDKIVGYIDTQFALDPVYASALGVDLQRILLSQPESGQAAFNIVLDMIQNGVQLVVIDSVAALVPLAQQQGSMQDQQMGAQARLLSKGLRKLTGPAAQHGATVLFTNQLRCLPKEYFAYSTEGLKRINDIQIGDKIFNGKQYKQVLNKYVVGTTNGKQFITKKKDSFKTSNEHMQLVVSKTGTLVQKKSKDIVVGQWLVSPIVNEYTFGNQTYNFQQKIKNIVVKSNTKIPKKYPNIVDEKLAFLLGCYYSDGAIIGDDKKGWRISFTQNSQQRFNLIIDCCNQLFSQDVLHYNYPMISIGGSFVVQLFQLLECNKYQQNKVVPSFIFNSSKNIIKSFIQGAFFDTEIRITKQSVLCLFTNKNNAVFDIQNLLYCFGIFSDNDISKANSNILKITGSDLVKFNEQIGFAQSIKKEIVDKCKLSINARGKYDIVPNSYSMNILQKYIDLGKVVYKQPYIKYLYDTKYSGLNTSRVKLIQCLKNLPEFNQQVEFLRNNRFYEIVKINDCQIDAIDIQVDGGLFVANKYLTHNCKIGVMFGNPQTTAGGKSLPYFSSIRISLNGGTQGQKNDAGQRITKIVKATVVKNKTYPPFKTAEFTIKFGQGIDKIQSLVNGAIDNKIFEKAGSWIKLYGQSFCQGVDALKQKINTPQIISDITLAINQINNGKTLQQVKQIVMKHLSKVDSEQKQKNIEEQKVVKNKKKKNVEEQIVTSEQV